MNKKRKYMIGIGIAIAVILVAIAVIIGFSNAPQKTKITVTHSNPRYSSLSVEIKVDTDETVGGFDMSLLYNTAKWELVEDSVQTGAEDITAIVDNGQIRLIFENSKNRSLDGPVVKLSFEMRKKVDDPLGLRLEVGEFYSAEGTLEDLDYSVEYLEEK